MNQPMPAQRYNATTSAAHQHYRQNQIMSADPIQLLLMTYDYILAGCREHSLEKVTRGLHGLQDHLNHEDGGQVAADLLSLYLYLADQARKNQYDEVAQIVRELRTTWAQAREQMLRQMAEARPPLSMAI